MPKESALQKIESHEKLCRIMQKQTHDKINGLQNQITRIERILLIPLRIAVSDLINSERVKFRVKFMLCQLIKL